MKMSLIYLEDGDGTFHRDVVKHLPKLSWDLTEQTRVDAITALRTSNLISSVMLFSLFCYSLFVSTLFSNYSLLNVASKHSCIRVGLTLMCVYCLTNFHIICPLFFSRIQGTRHELCTSLTCLEIEPLSKEASSNLHSLICLESGACSGVGVSSVNFSFVMLVAADLLPVAHCGQRIAWSVSLSLSPFLLLCCVVSSDQSDSVSRALRDGQEIRHIWRHTLGIVFCCIWSFTIVLLKSNA
jgi:hypothetical protein